VIGVVGDVFTGLAVVGAAVSAYFAWRAISKANESAVILNGIAARLDGVSGSMSGVVATSQGIVDQLAAELTRAERVHAEDRLMRRLAQLERVSGALHGMAEGIRRFQMGDPEHLRVEQAALRAALSVIPRDDLTLCREAAGAIVPHAPGNVGTIVSSLPDAMIELNSAVDAVLRQLRDLGST
jgi:hypothetical protein